jgi:hypothetical protein
MQVLPTALPAVAAPVTSPATTVISMHMPTMAVPQGMCAQDIRSAQLRMGGSHAFAAGHGLLTHDQRARRRARIA